MPPGAPSATLASSPSLRRGVAVLLVGLGIAAVAALIPPIFNDRVTADDFVQDWLAARAVADGADPYTPTADLFARYLPAEAFFDDVRQPVPHPPALIVLYRPFAAMPLAPARLAWLVLSASAFVVAGLLAARAAGLGPSASWVVGFGLLAVPVVQKDLAYGQSNGLLLLGLVLSWRGLRSGAPVAAGVAAGVIAAFKLFPLLLVVALLRARRVRAVGAMLGTFVGVSVAGALLVGAEAATRFVGDVAEANTAYWAPAPMNMSLSAVPMRWLTDNTWFPGGIDAPGVARVVMIALIGGAALVAWRTPAGRTGDPFLASVPLMLLASPLLWEFSLPLMLPVVLVIAMRSPGIPPPLLLIAFAVIALGVPPGLPLPEDAGVLAQVAGYGLATYGLIAVVVADATGVRSRGRGAASATAAST